MPDTELMSRLTTLSNFAFDTMMELNKAKHMSSRTADFFDLREGEWSDLDKGAILTGYRDTAMDYDITHDYILRSVSAVQNLYITLEELRNQLAPKAEN